MPKAVALKVALAAGHHNTDGGNATEYRLVGELTEAYALHLRLAGADVRVITPDGPDLDTNPGDGQYPGGLQDVGRKVVQWANTGWVADLFVELHTEGVATRGAFGVYPDWGDDYDADADLLGTEISFALEDEVGIPVRGSGSMGEKDTGVGRAGSRLGVFLTTAPVQDTTIRLIMEHGAHAHPEDLAILNQPGTANKIGHAATAAIVRFFGASPATVTFPTGIVMHTAFGFYQFWDKHGGTPIFGYPITDELEEGGLTVQYFQRARFELHADGKVMLGLVGSELLEALRGVPP